MTLSELQNEINTIGQKINVPINLLPTFDFPRGDGHPYIELDNFSLFHYVISEQGNEYDRKLFNNKKELFYQVFLDITFSMASDYELKHRKPNQDFRRVLFNKQKKLMTLLDVNWELKVKNEHLNTLKFHPFND